MLDLFIGFSFFTVIQLGEIVSVKIFNSTRVRRQPGPYGETKNTSGFSQPPVAVQGSGVVDIFKKAF